MDSLRLVLIGVAAGMKDAIWGMKTVISLEKSYEQRLLAVAKGQSTKREQLKRCTNQESTSRRNASNSEKSNNQEGHRLFYRIIQCCGFNGGVFMLSILAFYQFVLPCLKYLMGIIFGGSPGLASTIWVWLHPLLAYTFSALWVLPLFLLSKLVNYFWFSDIADSAYRHVRGRPQMLPSLSKWLADTFFSIIIQGLFLIQSLIVGLIPLGILGWLISLVHLCLLYSLYAFEYKWFNMGWELHKRLSFIEQNWPYFVGFGLPLAIITTLPESYILSGCIFAMAFPLFIISGNEATPLTMTCGFQLQLFSPVVYISNAIFHYTIRASMEHNEENVLHKVCKKVQSALSSDR